MGSREVQEDPPPIVSKKSWAKVTKEEKVLKKYDFDISVSEGKQSVTVPAEIVEKANLLWDDFVIIKFLETAPHVAKVHVILNKIWAFGEKDQKLDVFEMDSTTMRVRVPNAKMRDKVIRRGMWNIAGIPMVASKWSPIEDGENKLTPLWVFLKKVPMSMYSWEGLSFIASAAGTPDYLHPETIACTNFEIAKICVKADLSKPLPQEIDYKINGEEVTVEFKYPWLPNKCSGCGKWGHTVARCGLKEKEMEVEKKQEESKEVEEKMQESNKEEKEIEQKSVEIEGEKEEGQIVEEWLTPGRIGRSSGKQNQSLKYGEVRIITPSRYSALSIDEEESKETDEEKKVEDGCIEKAVIQLYEEEKEASKTQRQNLPRESKTRHKILAEATQDAKVPGPSNKSRKGTRKNLN